MRSLDFRFGFGHVPSSGSGGPTAPGTPTIGTATRGNASASIAFTPPGSDGGSTITGYTATSTPGSITGSGSSSPVTVSGLANGTSYTFTVHATNAIGNSAESGASNSVTPATVPGAPTIGTATGSNASASVAFTAPGSNGGSAITGYTATSSPGGFTGSGSSSPLTVSGLSNGTAYTFTVHATNAVGNSSESAASNSVTPSAGGSAFTPDSGYGFSGTFADGQSVTITKTGAFGTKPNGSKPAWYWNPGQDGTTALNALSRNTSWATDTGSGPQFGAILANTVATGSAHSYEVNSSNAGAPAIIDGMSLGATPTNSRVWSKWRTNFSGADAWALTNPSQWNLKGKRCWSGTSGGAHDYKTGFGDDNANDNPVMFYENTDPGGNTSIAGGSLPKNTWLTENITLHQGSLNASNTVTKYEANGKLLTTYTNVGFADSAHSTNSTDCSAALTRWYSEQLQSVPGGLKFFYDMLYLDDSFCAVFISDQSSWDDSVTRAIEIQIPTTWTADSITFTIRKGEMTSLTGKYLYVVKSDGTTVLRIGVGS